jgi:hypothetical protein
MAPKDAGFHFIATHSTNTEVTTPHPSTSGTLDLMLSDHDISFGSDTQG